MNKKTKVFLLDLLIVVFLLFVLLLTASYFFNEETKMDTSEKNTVILFLEAESINAKYVNLLNISDCIYFSDSSEYIGVIKDIKLTETAYSSQTSNDETYYEPELYNVNITVECQASYDETAHCYYINAHTVKHNDKINIRVPEFEFNAKINQITTISGILSTSEIDNEKE